MGRLHDSDGVVVPGREALQEVQRNGALDPVVADLGYLRDRDDSSAATLEERSHLRLCATACLLGLAEPEFDLDQMVPGEHFLEGLCHVTGSHAVFGAPRSHVLQVGEQPLERCVSRVDVVGVLPLAPLAEDVGLGLLVDADRVEAASGGQVLVLRLAREVRIGIEVSVDLDEDLESSACRNAAEILSLVDRLEHDDELWLGCPQRLRERGLLVEGVVEVGESSAKAFALRGRGRDVDLGTAAGGRGEDNRRP